MLTLIYYVLFFILSIYILLKAIGYALYEINTIQNKIGGIVVIAFSVIAVIFSNIMIWIH